MVFSYIFDSDCSVQTSYLFDSLSADCQESNLALLASPLTDRANYLHPKGLYIHYSVGLKHFTEVFTYRPRASLSFKSSSIPLMALLLGIRLPSGGGASSRVDRRR